MAGKAGSMEAPKWMMAPCSAGKSTADKSKKSTAAKSKKGAVAGTAAKSKKGAVAGTAAKPKKGDVMQCPSTKRKAEAGSSSMDRDTPLEGWIDGYKQAEPASSDPQSRAAAIDKMLQDAILLKQAPGGLGPELTRRLTKGEIRSIIAFKPEPFPSADYLDELAEFDPPESIAERKRQHAEDVARFAVTDGKYEAFRQDVIRGIKKNGYYEVDVEYAARMEKASLKQYNPFDFLDEEQRRFHVATPEQDEQWLREGCYGQYVPDEEEELLINCGDDDASDAE